MTPDPDILADCVRHHIDLDAPVSATNRQLPQAIAMTVCNMVCNTFGDVI